jgi:choice-of-anchor B domain-containing protein
MPRIILLFLSGILFSGFANAQSSSNIRLLCNWQDTTNAPLNTGGQRWNDVWGFTWNGKEYAVLGGTNGAHVIDVDHCEERAFLPGRSTGVIHRDYKTYSHYLYAVADEGVSSMQVFDYSYLPDSLHLVWESNPGAISRSHNIFIDTARARLYCASVNSLSLGHDNIQVYSLADPEAPKIIAAINDFDNTHDIYVRNDTAWCSNGPAGYLVLDMSHLPQTRVIGGLISYPYKGYNHSSWMGYDYIGVMTDETFGMPVKVIDARNPEVIEVLSNFAPRGTDTTSLPHNPYLLGSYAFISYYMDGLQIYDISDRKQPVRVGFYDTYPRADGQDYAGAWGVYPYLPSRRILLGDMQTGLYVFDADQAMPKLSAGPALNGSRFGVYPNPMADKVFLQLPQGATGRLKASLYTIAGSLVRQIDLDIASGSNPPVEVSLPADYSPGIYVLRAAIGGQSFTARLTKR